MDKEARFSHSRFSCFPPWTKGAVPLSSKSLHHVSVSCPVIYVFLPYDHTATHKQEGVPLCTIQPLTPHETGTSQVSIADTRSTALPVVGLLQTLAPNTRS